MENNISAANKNGTHSLKSELHSAQILLSSTVDHYKSKREEVTFLKKDFKQKEDKFLEEFLDLSELKDKIEDRLYKQDQSVQTVHMLCKPKSFYDEKAKDLEAARSKVHDESKLVSKLEREYLNLQIKSCEPYNAKDVTALIEQNDCDWEQLGNQKGRTVLINCLYKDQAAAVWKATGKLFADIGYQWRPTGKKLALGKLDCGYQWIALGEMCHLTKLSVKCRTGHALVSGLRLFKTYDGESFKAHEFCGKVQWSSPICLLSKASKSKSWLWHRRLNHLNFGPINDLARKEFWLWLESMAPARMSSGPEPFILSPGQLKSGLAPNDKELEISSQEDGTKVSSSGITSFGIPLHPVFYQKTLATDALWCCFPILDVKVGTHELQNGRDRRLLFQAMHEEITEFDKNVKCGISTSPNLCYGFALKVDLQVKLDEYGDVLKNKLGFVCKRISSG
ncbi:retrovirus-related pol polyprotein from transposon TNT 1-94 [Tanacetum coccineum]